MSYSDTCSKDSDNVYVDCLIPTRVAHNTKTVIMCFVDCLIPTRVAHNTKTVIMCLLTRVAHNTKTVIMCLLIVLYRHV